MTPSLHSDIRSDAGIDVSYVLTVFNKAWALPRTLASLRAQDDETNLEFLFVDDGSTDGSVDLLRAEAARDPRIRVLATGANMGPAIRLNQGALAARGRLLAPMDADDLSPPNACRWMRARLAESGAPLIYGRRRPGDIAEPIPEDAPVSRIAEPLRFAAERVIVHMALMVERAVFLEAGGADQNIFIQDQSLSLRLARAAPAMLWTDATTCWAPPSPAPTLSANTTQQHHDRFFAMRNMLATLPEGHEAAPALIRQAISALWKLRRDEGGAAALSPEFLRYIAIKTGVAQPSLRSLDALGAKLRACEGVRRPAPKDAGR